MVPPLGRVCWTLTLQYPNPYPKPPRTRKTPTPSNNAKTHHRGGRQGRCWERCQHPVGALVEALVDGGPAFLPADLCVTCGAGQQTCGFCIVGLCMTPSLSHFWLGYQETCTFLLHLHQIQQKRHALNAVLRFAGRAEQSVRMFSNSHRQPFFCAQGGRRLLPAPVVELPAPAAVRAGHLLQPPQPPHQPHHGPAALLRLMGVCHTLHHR